MKKTIRIISAVLAVVLTVAGVSVFAASSEIREKKKHPQMFNITEEQKNLIIEKFEKDLVELLENGDITQEQYDGISEMIKNGGMPGRRPFGERGQERKEMPELTEEQKQEITLKIKTELDEKLAAGEITQEEYDERIEAVQNGDFKGMGGRPGGRPAPKIAGGNRETEGEGARPPKGGRGFGPRDGMKSAE